MPPGEPTQYVPALRAPDAKRSNPLTRSAAGVMGMVTLAAMMLLCLGTLPFTLSGPDGVPRYEAGTAKAARLPPVWAPHDESEMNRAIAAIPEAERREIAEAVAPSLDLAPDDVLTLSPDDGEAYEVFREALSDERPTFFLGSDPLGRSLLVRVLTGGGISLGIGLAAALLSVVIGTLYGAISGYAGGVVDGVMMRIVDVLYGLPYILLVVLLAVAVDAMVQNWRTGRVVSFSEQRLAYVERQADAVEGTPTEEQFETWQADAMAEIGTGEIPGWQLTAINVATLFIAIGGVSWLTMARVIRGQVLSLKNQPFVESARAVGASPVRIFVRHLLPNLVGPIVVYATLTVPQAILQESFLSFLGIGVQPPLPSWGNLAADGLVELNRHRSHWWLLVVPCLLLGVTLLALNFVGEGLREAFDPKSRGRA